MALLHRFVDQNDKPTGWMFWCPACECGHIFYVEAPPHWKFDGDMEAPTFEPSYRSFRPATTESPEETICHLFCRKGRLQFLADSPHRFAGKIVPMVDWREIGREYYINAAKVCDEPCGEPEAG